MPKRRQLRGFDLKQIEGFTSLIGVDEAGRGAFAGPVVARRSPDRPEFPRRPVGGGAGRAGERFQALDRRRARRALARLRKTRREGPAPRPFRIGDRRGDRALQHLRRDQAGDAARARGNLSPQRLRAEDRSRSFLLPRATAPQFRPTVSCRVLIDGLALRHFPYPHQAIVNGDGRSLCIAMASIIAKVTRDRNVRARRPVSRLWFRPAQGLRHRRAPGRAPPPRPLPAASGDVPAQAADEAGGPGADGFSGGRCGRRRMEEDA